MAYFIAPKEYFASGVYCFEKAVSYSKATKILLKIFASTRYILRINGKYFCEGPCRGSEKVFYYDTISVEFPAGENLIQFQVLYVNQNYTTVYKLGMPLVVCESDDQSISTDESWLCSYLKGYSLNPMGMLSLPPFESVSRRIADISVPVKALWKCNFQKKSYYNAVGASIPFVLEERPIPMILPGEEVTLKPIKSGKDFIEYDAGEYLTAKIILELAEKSQVKVIYAECYSFPDGKHIRDDKNGTLDGYYDTLETGEKACRLEPFWYRAFRFIRIEGDCEAVKAIRAFKFHYPFDITGAFQCSNDTYNQINDVSLRTLLCCSHDLVVDCPYYEQQQYEMDYLVEYAAISRLTADTRLIRKGISEFAESQRPNGLLCSIAPATYTQIIPGHSLFWIMLLRLYLDQTADAEFVSGYVGVMDRILEHFNMQIRQHGYLTATRYWDFIDWVPEWDYGSVPLQDNEAHTIYNLYYLTALSDAAKICTQLGRDGLAGEYQTRRSVLLETLKEKCYDPQAELFSNGSKTKAYCMHTIIWSILANALSPEENERMLSHLFDPALQKCSFSMNFFLFRALEQVGQYDLAFPFFAQWESMLKLHCTTWCENPDSPRSECHAWSCAPYYEFSANILGVTVGSEQEITIAPKPGSLTWAKGIVPTRFGAITIDWEICDEVFTLRLSGAASILKTIVLPNGTKAQTTDENFEITEKRIGE